MQTQSCISNDLLQFLNVMIQEKKIRKRGSNLFPSLSVPSREDIITEAEKRHLCTSLLTLPTFSFGQFSKIKFWLCEEVSIKGIFERWFLTFQLL